MRTDQRVGAPAHPVDVRAASVSARLDLKGSVREKLLALHTNDAELYDLIFVHRDADNAGIEHA